MAGNDKSSKSIHIAVCSASAAITIFLLELYSALGLDFISWMNLPETLSYALQALSFVAHWFVFSKLYDLIHFIYRGIKQKAWRKKNPECNLEGAWLHIHEKGSVRIGVADITQDFYDIKVSAENLHPNVGNSKITTWHYVGTEFKPDENSNIKLIGCYYAQRQGDESKQGFHLFTDITTENGMVAKMSGEFGDALKVRGGESGVVYNDQVGKIHFFRMTPEIKEYLGYKSKEEYDKSKLVWIMNAEKGSDVYNSEFVKVVKTLYNKTEFLKKWKEFQRKYEETQETCDITISDIEVAVYKLVAYSMYADRNRLDRVELETLRDLTGMMPENYVHSTLNKEEVFGSIKNVMKTISAYKETHELFRSLIRNSCRSIILCNLEESTNEISFLDELESIVAI